MNKKLFVFGLLFLTIGVLSTPYQVNAGLFSSPITLQTSASQHVDQKYLEYPREIDDFYTLREGKSFWTHNFGPSKSAETLMNALKDSWTHGLNPQHYHTARLEALLNSSKLSQELELEREVLLTDAYIRYMRDLSGKRIDTNGSIFWSKNWRMPADPVETLELLNSSKSIKTTLETYIPKSQTYAILREHLIELYEAPDVNRSKMERIIANMERMRWVKIKQPERFIMVNIPAARLWAVDNGAVTYDMPVIVGRKKRPTNSFVTTITGVRLNPTWTVPKTIKSEDILPKLKADPNYLANKGMTLISYTQDNAKIDPTEVDWQNITEANLAGYGMVQAPGRNNPLGEARFFMPNPFDIFIHGTNRQSDFSQNSALLSSGCIRVERPEILADFLMKNDDGWYNGQAKEIIDKKRKRDITTENPIPIYLLYYTVWVDKNGEIVYGDDIYKQDNLVIKALRRIDGFAI